MFKFGENNIGKVILGDNTIGKVYYGSNLVYQSGPPAPPGPKRNYFYSVPLEDGTFTLTIASSVTLAMLEYVSYSLDNGKTWVTTDNVASTEVTITTPEISAGDWVLWKGSGNAYASGTAAGSYSTFTCSADYNVGGDIGSLFYGDNYTGTFSAFTANYAMCSFFRDSVTLVNAGDLVLSPRSCTNTGCYRTTFYGCSKLETAPTILLNTATGTDCCYYMFGACSSLLEIPVLNIPTASASSFVHIFRGCSSITEADISGLKITQVPNYAFYDCASLTSFTLPSTVTSIGEYAFSGASASTACNIATVDLSPYSITRLYTHAFDYCRATSITLSSTMTRLDAYCLASTLITGLQFPSTLTYIGGYIFSGCTGLRGKTIDLSGCTSLTTLNMGGCEASVINIPSSVTTMGSDAFRGTRFTEIDLSSCTNLTEIPTRCFYQTGSYLALIKLPSSITSVLGSNFTTTVGGKVVCYATTPPACASSLNGKTNTYFYVPYSADHSVLAAYQADTYWGELTHLAELNQDGTIPENNS